MVVSHYVMAHDIVLPYLQISHVKIITALQDQQFALPIIWYDNRIAIIGGGSN